MERNLIPFVPEPTKVFSVEFARDLTASVQRHVAAKGKGKATTSATYYRYPGARPEKSYAMGNSWQEVFDTDCREQIMSAILALPEPLPKRFGMFSAKGNAVVKQAIKTTVRLAMKGVVK